jgi:hypothetical protein
MMHFSPFFWFISKILLSALGSKLFFQKQNPMRYRQKMKNDHFLIFGCALGSKFRSIFLHFFHFGPILGPFS